MLITTTDRHIVVHAWMMSILLLKHCNPWKNTSTPSLLDNKLTPSLHITSRPSKLTGQNFKGYFIPSWSVVNHRKRSRELFFHWITSCPHWMNVSTPRSYIWYLWFSNDRICCPRIHYKFNFNSLSLFFSLATIRFILGISRYTFEVYLVYVNIVCSVCFYNVWISSITFDSWACMNGVCASILIWLLSLDSAAVSSAPFP